MKQVSVEEINAQYGKLPPQAVDIERAVLGAMILERDAYPLVASIIKPESFYKEEHQIICNAVKKIHDSTGHVDLMQVTQYLRDHGLLDSIGGPKYLMDITRNVASAAHIEFHASIVAQKFMKRELIRISQELQNKSYDDTIDVIEVVDFVRSNISNLEKEHTSGIKSFNDGVDEVYDRIKLNIESNKDITGYPIGIKSIDEFTSGFQTTDLVFVAAEPGQGKTSFLLTSLVNISKTGEPVSVISFEMPFLQLVARVISQETDIPVKRILHQQLINDEITRIDNVADEVRTLPIAVSDTHTNSLTATVSLIRHLYEKEGIRVFGIDYIQLMDISGERTGREEKLGKIARTLKNLAKELDILIIILSQLSRAENKQNHRPTLDRLRGSGQLEEAADIVIFIYRPEVYGEDYVYILETDMIPSENKALIDFAKGRNIGTEKFIINFNKSSGKFHESSSSFDYDPDKFHDSTKDAAF